MTRAQYVRGLARVDRIRHETTGSPQRMAAIQRGAVLADVGRNSAYAKAVALGWITPIRGAFRGELPITANEASLGAVGVVGAGSASRTFARRLKREVPGTGNQVGYRAAQVFARTLGMRYNHPAGSERFEVGPGEAMRVGHVAYMLRAAATAPSWRISGLQEYTRFDIPALGAHQRTVLSAGVRLIGQPYVWGGETEGTQPEGHGGFDCSGFVWRSVMNSGVPSSERHAMGARTSMDMSNIARRQRLTRSRLRPGDIMFFGTQGPDSAPSDNFHAGVWMGNGWFIHSSGSNDGVTISRLQGYWSDSFSWGRRILRSA
jgi:cell wall-associated NlpC family hydrolase